MQEDGGTCWENPGFVEVMGEVHETFHSHQSFPKVWANTCVQPTRDHVQERHLSSSFPWKQCFSSVGYQCLVSNMHVLIFECATKNITEEIQMPPGDSPWSKSEVLLH